MGKQTSNQNDNSAAVKVKINHQATKTSSESPKNSKKGSESMKLPTVRKLHFKPSRIIFIGIVIILAAFFGKVAIWEHAYLNRMEGSEREEPVNLSNSGESEENVDREQPTTTEITEYTVAPDKPRYFSIPTLGIRNARILEVGTLSNGEMATPYNIWDVGWYTGSSLPGTTGVSVMNGHGGVPNGCIFGNLPRIQVGDTIQIEMGDGREYTYRVVDTATKALGDEANAYMQAEAFKSPVAGQPSLTLITCVGEYWLSSKTYSHRLFVRAVLEN